MDLMNLGDGQVGRHSYALGAARIAARCLLVGVKQDALIPAHELRCLADLINTTHQHQQQGQQTGPESTPPCAGRTSPATMPSSGEAAAGSIAAAAAAATTSGQRATFLEMDSPYGHDAFLKEYDWLGPRLRAFLEAGLEAQLEAERVHNTGHNAP